MTITSNLSVFTPAKGRNCIIYSQAIVATGNDTSTADSATIDNSDGSITDLVGGVVATNQTGTNPTLTISFIGSFDETVWFAIKSDQGSTPGTNGTMDSGALNIATASTTNVGTHLATSNFRKPGGFPPKLRMRITPGGTSNPGGTYVGQLMVNRG